MWTLCILFRYFLIGEYVKEFLYNKRGLDWEITVAIGYRCKCGVAVAGGGVSLQIIIYYFRFIFLLGHNSATIPIFRSLQNIVKGFFNSLLSNIGCNGNDEYNAQFSNHKVNSPRAWHESTKTSAGTNQQLK